MFLLRNLAKISSFLTVPDDFREINGGKWSLIPDNHIELEEILSSLFIHI